VGKGKETKDGNTKVEGEMIEGIVRNSTQFPWGRREKKKAIGMLKGGGGGGKKRTHICEEKKR